MAGVRDVFDKLFKVIRHANQIQLYNAIGQVDASWVHVSEHDSILVDMLESSRQHPEYLQCLLEVEQMLAKCLPRATMIWRLRVECHEAAWDVRVLVMKRSHTVEQVLMVEPLKLMSYPVSLLGLVVDGGHVADRRHNEPLSGQLAVIRLEPYADESVKGFLIHRVVSLCEGKYLLDRLRLKLGVALFLIVLLFVFARGGLMIIIFVRGCNKLLIAFCIILKRWEVSLLPRLLRRMRVAELMVLRIPLFLVLLLLARLP